MRKFRLISKDDIYEPLVVGQVYDGSLTPEDWGWSVTFHATMYPKDWQEVFEEEKVQLTETEKIVLIDFLNEHFEDLGEFINGVNTSDQNYNNLEGRWSYNKISNLIDKIEKL